MEIARRRKYVEQANLTTFNRLLESTSKLVRGLGRAKKLLLVKNAAKTAGAVLLACYVLSRVLA
jgi:hypothetical protein